ncbi:MAG: ferritin family protein [Spirochaetes bacterium]|nr:ferritin family protein [Spirochaetota bacterium]
MPYTIKEIIDIAIGIERAGYEFYSGCAGRFTDMSVHDAFDFLAREELEHERLFQSFHGKTEAAGLYNEEYYAYLRAIGGGRIFDSQHESIAQILSGINTPMDALKHAFSAEKDSILFYSELKELFTKDKDTTLMLDRIINEERKHVSTILDVIDKLKISS